MGIHTFATPSQNNFMHSMVLYKCLNLTHSICPSIGCISSSFVERLSVSYFMRLAQQLRFSFPLFGTGIVLSITKLQSSCIPRFCLGYGGQLRVFLEDATNTYSEPGIRLVRDVLNRTQRYLDNLAEIGDLRELHPSEIHRQIEHDHHSRNMAKIMKEGMESSVFHGHFHQQYVLYGTSMMSYLDAGIGQFRRISAEMRPISVSVEHPTLATLDPEGLHICLIRFRRERLKHQ